MLKVGQKSLKLNMILNSIKGLMSIVFPLVTFPYVSKILGVDNLGQYNFAQSVISYFLLISGLGISTYAIREGARIRDDEIEFQKFASQMICINIFSTILSYSLFFILLLIVQKFQDYKILLIILSLQIIFKTIGVEWLYSIYEEYAYITIRSIAFQLLSLILLFSFVKDQTDLYVYAGITVLSSVGSCILNFVHSRKYCRFLLCKIDWRKHVRPIIVLFAMSATVTIYVSSDITILGFLCDDYTVGIYSVSTKVYTIVKTILSSVLVVSIPRLSSYLGKEEYDIFNSTADDIYKTLITLVVPSIVGIIVLSKEIVLLISTPEYIVATSSLSLLAVALFFCLGAWFWGQCILVPCKKERIVFRVTIVSAVLNIILNFVLVSIWKEIAAAVTTIIAEALSFILCGIEGRKQVRFSNLGKHYFKVLFGCAMILFIGHIVHAQSFSEFINILIIVPSSIIAYFATEIILDNESVSRIILNMKKKIQSKK